MNELAHVLEKKHIYIIGSETWYVFDYFLNIVVITVQSGLKLNDSTIVAAGVEMHEQVCNTFAQRSHRTNCRQNLNSKRKFLWSSGTRLL